MLCYIMVLWVYDKLVFLLMFGYCCCNREFGLNFWINSIILYGNNVKELVLLF